MKLHQLTFSGPPIDDLEILCHLPTRLRSLLEQINGFIQFGGGLHVRGACQQPLWHSLRWVWMGNEAFHLRYKAISEEDVPFAQDCVGDQFLLRQSSVVKLATETGDIHDLSMSLIDFLKAVQVDPERFLGLAPLVKFHNEGGTLLPGELLNSYPPFCTDEASQGVSLSAAAAQDRLRFLAGLSRQLQGTPDGGVIEIEITK